MKFSAQTRLPLIDALRFGAAAAVLLYHLTATSTASRYWGASPDEVFGPLNEVSRYGWLAVEVLFMISGFVILLTAEGRGLRSFVASRAGRLFPAYWACVALTALLQSLWHDGLRPGLLDTLLNLTMVQDLLDAQSVQVVFWTLLVELKFYLLVGLLLAAGPLTSRRALALAVLWPVVGGLADAFTFPGSGFLVFLLVPHYAPYFSIGILLYLVHRDGLRWPTGLALAGALAAGVVRVVGTAASATELQGVPVSPVVGTVGLLAGVGALWAAARLPLPGAPRLGAALAVGGALTYPLYLVHMQFGYAAVDALDGADGAVGPWGALALACALSVALAAVIHYAVERPGSPRLRRLVLGSDARSAAPAAARPAADLTPAAAGPPSPAR
ncbi:acyltransferase family protein [Antribacter gilvus]|uniref:acyltransferase family protein n=1 Tax=Antribacter gilvus TaxID=2304675 RepID=UPI0013E067C1|nr:acyltransferase [Antribacter gilvus]